MRINLPTPRLDPVSSPHATRRRPTLPLHLVLIGLFLLLTVGTVGIVETLFFFKGQTAAQDFAYRWMHDTSRQVELYLETYLQTPQIVNRLNADAVSSGKLDLQNLPALEQHLFNQLMQFESLSSLQVGNQQNDFRLVTRQDGLRLLQADADHPTQWKEYTLNRKGRKSELLNTFIETQARNQPWYQTALFSGKPTWGVISQSATGEVFLAATQPVFDRQGKVSGVFSSAIVLNVIDRFLSQLQLVKSGQVFILEPNGWVISTSDQRWAERGLPRFNLVDGSDPVAQQAGRSLLQHFGDFSRIDRSQQLIFLQAGKRHFLQVMPFQDDYGLNWLIVVTVPEAAFLEKISLSTQTTLLLWAIGLWVSIALGLWLARFISQPMRQLSRASHALAQGEWHQTFEEDSPLWEVQVLTNAFNRTARQLRGFFNRAATALEESEEKFAKMFRSTPDPIAIVTQEGRYLEVNDAFVKLFGYSRAEIIGHPVSEIKLWVHPEEHKHYVRSVEALGRISDQEYMFRKKSGAVLTALFSAESINIGGEQCFIGMSKEITDRKQVEDCLRQSEATKQQILKAIPDLIVWMSSDGTCLDLIDGSVGINLYKKSEAVGKNLYSLLPFELAQARMTAIQQALQTSEVQIYEQQLIVQGNLQYEEVRVVSVGSDRILVIVRDITQRKLSEMQRQQAEAELEAERSFFRQVIDVMPSSVFVKDLEGRFLIANQAVAETYGCPVENIIGRREADFNPKAAPEQLAWCAANDLDVITSGQPQQTLPYQIVKATGEQRWVQTLRQPWINAQGQRQGVVGNTIDVTDLKQAEADLRWQIKRSQLFADIALKMRQSFQFEEILQTTVTEVQTFLQVDRVLIYQFQKNGSGRVIQEAIVPGVSTTLEQEFVDRCFPEVYNLYRQGRIRVVADIETLDVEPCHLDFLRSLGVRAKLVMPIFVGNQLWGLLIAHHCQHPRLWSDFEIGLLQELANQAGVVLAQSQLLVAQAESEERFRSAFDAAPIGIALIGLDERWIRINPALCRMLGSPESSLLGMNASDSVHPEDIDKFRYCVGQTLTHENYTAQAELRYCCNDRRIAWALLSLSVVRGTRNQPLYYVSQIQDITERHALDQMKNEFISIVSHELRTPLTAMRGSLGLLATGVYDHKPDKAKRMIEIAVNNSDRLVRLVNDILDLERLSSDKVQLMRETCNVTELIQRAVESVQAIADEASVAIVTETCIEICAETYTTDPSSVQVWGEPDAIIQTLTNLLSNAIKFSPTHTIVQLSACLQPDAVLFQIKDQGRGIPLDKIEVVFERFQQVDVSDARQKGGTGLGLAICRRIVQRHGGEIWVESTVGEGSSFYFTLPIPPRKPV